MAAREQGEVKGIAARAGASGLKWPPGWLLTPFSTCEEREHQGRVCHSHFMELTQPERGLWVPKVTQLGRLQTGTLVPSLLTPLSSPWALIPGNRHRERLVCFFPSQSFPHLFSNSSVSSYHFCHHIVSIFVYTSDFVKI